MPHDFHAAAARAKTLTRSDASGLLECVEKLAKKAGTYTPEVLLLPTKIANAAFHPASGKLWVSEGLLDLMESRNLHAAPSREMEAILAHEMGHVKFRLEQMAPMMLLLGGLPIAGLGALYLLDKTHQKLKAQKQAQPDQDAAFWESFHEVTDDQKKKGPAKTYADFWMYSSPAVGKLVSKDPAFKDMDWGQVGFHEAKMLAAKAALTVGSFYACQPIALRNEFQSDRFAVALTGDKEGLISAFNKLSGSTVKGVIAKGKAVGQQGWAERIIEAFDTLLHNTVMAHPSIAERIELLRGMNVEAAAKSFHL